MHAGCGVGLHGGSHTIRKATTGRGAFRAWRGDDHNDRPALQLRRGTNAGVDETGGKDHKQHSQRPSSSGHLSGGRMNFSSNDDACREPLDCGIWGRSWEPSPTTQREHAGHPGSSCTPNEASPSPSRFSTPEPMRTAENTTAPHAGGLLSPEDWEAALEEEIHDVSILGEDASSPSNSELGRRSQLRRRRVHMDAARQPPKGPLPQSTTVESAQTRRKGSKTRSLWSNEALKDAMKALNADYTYGKVSKAFGIPRTTLKDHYLGKRTSRKMEGKGVLSKEEDDVLCKYILGMAEIGLPLTPIQVQHKVAEIT